VVKTELVKVLKEKLPELQQRDVELAVNCILAQMSDAITKGERIEVRGFGSFDLRHRASRIGRNPKSGESLSLPAKVRVHFKPGKEMRDRVDAARDQCDITE
jgi:integration host factor subunit beta